MKLILEHQFLDEFLNWANGCGLTSRSIIFCYNYREIYSPCDLMYQITDSISIHSVNAVDIAVISESAQALIKLTYDLSIFSTLNDDYIYFFNRSNFYK